MATFSDSGVFADTGLAMSTGSTTPDFGASKNSKPNVKTIKFGDGYEQRLSLGVQQDPKVWSLKWTTLSDADANGIEKFFENRFGSQSFDWTPLGDTSSYKFICREWGRTFKYSNINEISAKFEQVFES